MRQFYTLYKQKLLDLRTLISITFPQGFRKSKTFGHWTLGNWGKNTFKQSEQVKKNQLKNFFGRGYFRPFWSKNVHI